MAGFVYSGAGHCLQLDVCSNGPAACILQQYSGTSCVCAEGGKSTIVSVH